MSLPRVWTTCQTAFWKSHVLCLYTNAIHCNRIIRERRGITIPNTNDGALTAFMMNMSEVRDQLLVLTSYVDNHMDVLPDEIHWGHVGSARRTLELLLQINQFLNLE